MKKAQRYFKGIIYEEDRSKFIHWLIINFKWIHEQQHNVFFGNGDYLEPKMFEVFIGKEHFNTKEALVWIERFNEQLRPNHYWLDERPMPKASRLGKR